MLVNRKTGTLTCWDTPRSRARRQRGRSRPRCSVRGWWAPRVSGPARTPTSCVPRPTARCPSWISRTATRQRRRRRAPLCWAARDRGRACRRVSTLGFASLPGLVSTGAGAAAVSGSDLWTLVASASSCLTDELHPVATAHEGLVVTARTRLTVPCARAAVESSGGLVGVASPGTSDCSAWAGRVQAETCQSPGRLPTAPLCRFTERPETSGSSPDRKPDGRCSVCRLLERSRGRQLCESSAPYRIRLFRPCRSGTCTRWIRQPGPSGPYGRSTPRRVVWPGWPGPAPTPCSTPPKHRQM